jgi:seryl-tRNA synthetase
MTIEDQLLEASAALSGLSAERDDLRATVEKLTIGAASELEALKVEAAVKDGKVAELAAALEVAAKEVEALKASALEAESIKVSASKEAAKIVASVGVIPVSLPQGDGAPAEAVNHYAAFMALPVGSKERNAYFEAHRSAIIKAAL